MKKILIIEDNAGVAELIGGCLKASGYQTLIACDGNKAMEFLGGADIDMVILDYSLPDMDGKQIIAAVNAEKVKMPPFIVSTGRGDEQLAVDMMKLGAYDYLIKDKTLISRLPEVVAKLDYEIERERELKHAQLALIQSEERFRNFVEKSGDFFIKISSEGYFNYVSPNWEVHVGYSFNEIASKEIFNFLHSDDITLLKTHIDKAVKAENNHFSTEYRIKDARGDWKYHAVKGYSVLEDDKIFVNCIARDITETKLMGKKIALAVFSAEENEKKRFAEKLHEDIGPLISAIKMSVGRIKSLDNIEEKGLSIIQYADKLIDDTVDQVRALANDLVPNVINDFGLIRAIRAQVKQRNNKKNREILFSSDADSSDTDKLTSIILYRALLKLIKLSSKSPGSSQIQIDIKLNNDKLHIIYVDPHFQRLQEKANNNLVLDPGLENMKSRIEALDGNMRYETYPPNGIRVNIVVPDHQ